MAPQTFDTLSYAKRRIGASVEQKQAEAHAEAVWDYIMSDPVTKNDLRNALLTQTVAFGAMLVVAGVSCRSWAKTQGKGAIWMSPAGRTIRTELTIRFSGCAPPRAKR